MEVTDEQTLWLGRNGEKLGPYTEALVRQWLAEGSIDGTTLAWRTGMAGWLPLAQVLGPIPGAAATPPPPPPPPFSHAPMGAAYGQGPLGGYPDPTGDAEARRRLPEPPAMHWFVVLVLSVVTIGIFGLIWPFIQASWVRKIDPSSKATTWLAIALACVVISWGGQMGVSLHNVENGMTSVAGAFGLFALLGLANLVFYYVAFFGMADSIRRELPKYGLIPDIGGVTLFFFTSLYLQGQLTWIERWKRTGALDPEPPKLVFWLLWLLFPVVAVALIGLVLLPHMRG